MDWKTCPSCEEEFKIVTESLMTPIFCPFCGEDLEDDLDELFDGEFDD
jgi:predicted RNA-binding Zn-ribbon protein involved in translation (DUF1610 family)